MRGLFKNVPDGTLGGVTTTKHVYMDTSVSMEDISESYAKLNKAFLDLSVLSGLETMSNESDLSTNELNFLKEINAISNEGIFTSKVGKNKESSLNEFSSTRDTSPTERLLLKVYQYLRDLVVKVARSLKAILYNNNVKKLAFDRLIAVVNSSEEETFEVKTSSLFNYNEPTGHSIDSESPTEFEVNGPTSIGKVNLEVTAVGDYMQRLLKLLEKDGESQIKGFSTLHDTFIRNKLSMSALKHGNQMTEHMFGVDVSVRSDKVMWAVKSKLTTSKTSTFTKRELVDILTNLHALNGSLNLERRGKELNSFTKLLDNYRTRESNYSEAIFRHVGHMVKEYYGKFLAMMANHLSIAYTNLSKAIL